REEGEPDEEQLVLHGGVGRAVGVDGRQEADAEQRAVEVLAAELAAPPRRREAARQAQDAPRGREAGRRHGPLDRRGGAGGAPIRPPPHPPPPGVIPPPPPPDPA